MATGTFTSPRDYPIRDTRGADNWKKYLAIAGIALVVMAAGIVIGAGVTVMYFGGMFLQQPNSPDQAARLITAQINDAADLSSEERVKTQEIVQKQLDEIAAIRKKYEGEVNKKLGAMSNGVTEIIGTERSDMCGDWMLRYRPLAPGGSEEKEEECCCCGGGSGCKSGSSESKKE